MTSLVLTFQTRWGQGSFLHNYFHEQVYPSLKVLSQFFGALNQDFKFENPFYEPPTVLISGSHENTTSALWGNSEGRCNNAINVWIEVTYSYKLTVFTVFPCFRLSVCFFVLLCLDFFLWIFLSYCPYVCDVAVAIVKARTLLKQSGAATHGNKD